MTITERIQAIETAIGVTNTKLQALIDELAGLRGTGPENTIRSINQSIWNMVGPAPGRTLTEIYAELLAIKTNIGLPTGDATTTAIGRLAALEYALTNNSAATLYALLWDIQQTLTLPGSIDRTILEELDLIRIAANTTNASLNPPSTPTTPPPGSTDPCSNPYTSTGQSVGSSIAAFLGQTVTYAQWSGTPPAGITIGSAYVTSGDTLHSDDWSQYSIYVSSRAPTFGVQGTSAQRFNTNTWVVLSGSEDFVFFVDGNFALTVTICGEGLIVDAGYRWLQGDFELINFASYNRYVPITTKYPELTYTTWGVNGRVIVGDWGGWRPNHIGGVGAEYVYGIDGLSDWGSALPFAFPAGTTHIVLHFTSSPGEWELLPPL